MGWREFVDAYFSFSRRDMIGIVTILLLTIFVFLSPKFFPSRMSPKTSTSDTAWITALKKLEKKEDYHAPEKRSPENDNNPIYQYDRSTAGYFNKKAELFYFDPNTLSSDGWERLGVREKTVKTIQNYLSKGGHFKKPEDLAKIYGIKKEDLEKLIPYARIEGKQEQTTFRANEKISFAKADRYKSIDINEADTTGFIALPGIGSKLAARIINFRDKLGGFHSISQVAETFGLADSTYQKIKQYLTLENNSVKKININTATIDELKIHPYIKYNLANPIIAYRNEHGPFSRIEDIKKVLIITEDIFIKLSPYLTAQ